MRFLLPVLCILLFSGCATDVPPPVTSQASIYDAIEKEIREPFGVDGQVAPTAAPAVNLVRTAALTGHEPGAKPMGESYAETAVKGGYAYLSRYGPESGLVIFNVSDIENPTFVSSLRLDAGFEPDIEVSDDGKWAFWETQRFPLSAETPKPDPGANLQRGIHIVDISDKANPRWAGFQPVTPDGPHSITYASIGGRHIVFSSTYAFAYAYGGVNVPGTQRLIIYELDASGPVATLRELASYIDPEAVSMSVQDRGRMPHDVSVSVHPFTGRTYAYIAYWDLGVIIVDVTDPAKPTRVGQANDFGPAKYKAVHMARQFAEPIDGRVIVVVEPEISGQPDTGYMTMVDVSDPTAPKYVSSWKIPGNASSSIGGPHYFDVRAGRVAMAHYGAGFWVFDVHDRENLERPRTVAYALVNETGQGIGPLAGLGNRPSAFDAWWHDDTHIVGGDFHAGLVVFRYTGPTPAQDERLAKWP
jgi:hypothetical protein